MVELQKGDENNALYSPIPTAPSANPAFANPLTWGFQDPSGNILVVNMETGLWMWTHSSGDTISYDAAGDRVVVVKGNATENITGNLNITVQGNASFDVTGTATYTAAEHQFMGPVTMSETLMVASSITDMTGSGNTQTVMDIRTDYDEHYHMVMNVMPGTGTIDTSLPTPQIPNV
jgi:phage gp45-like